MRASPRTRTRDQQLRQLAAQQGGRGLVLGLALQAVILITPFAGVMSSQLGMGVGDLEEEGFLGGRWQAPSGLQHQSLSSRGMGGISLSLNNER